jgi:hypothetical protein
MLMTYILVRCRLAFRLRARFEKRIPSSLCNVLTVRHLVLSADFQQACNLITVREI